MPPAPVRSWLPSGASSGQRAISSTSSPSVGQKLANGVPRWSVGNSRHSSSRLNSWLRPTSRAATNSGLVSSSVTEFGASPPMPGIAHSGQRASSSSAIGTPNRGCAMIGPSGRRSSTARAAIVAAGMRPVMRRSCNGNGATVPVTSAPSPPSRVSSMFMSASRCSMTGTASGAAPRRPARRARAPLRRVSRTNAVLDVPAATGSGASVAASVVGFSASDAEPAASRSLLRTGAIVVTRAATDSGSKCLRCARSAAAAASSVAASSRFAARISPACSQARAIRNSCSSWT